MEKQRLKLFSLSITVLLLIGSSRVTASDQFATDPLVSYFVHGHVFPHQRSNMVDQPKVQISEKMDIDVVPTFEDRFLTPKNPGEVPNSNLIMVNTPLGPMRGTKMSSISGKWFYAFRGIKYGQANRFEFAEPLGPWANETVYDARLPGPMCPQIGSLGGVQGDEDCLYLNVYFPHYAYCQKELLPVAFNIHGGGFNMYSGYMPGRGEKYMMDKCICLVSINYRLGALGFLATHDSIPGNLGLHDQVLALQWVKDNIKYFRGDPDRVTPLGVSAGGASVSHLMASPLAKGLFSGAISQSGTALNPWAIQRDPLTNAQLLSLALNCPQTGSTADIRECLEAKTVKEIVEKQDTLSFLPFPVFTPVIEPSWAERPFQTENPANLFRTGNFNQVPYICGFVENEAPIDDPLLALALNMAPYQMAPLILMYDKLELSQEQMDEITDKIREFYFGDHVIGSPETKQSIVDVASDRGFVQGIMETVNLTSKYVPVYPYVMTYKGGKSVVWTADFEIPIMAHGDDVQYFTNENPPQFPYGTEQYDFSQSVVSLWASFIESGKPWDMEWRMAASPVNLRWRQLDRRFETLSYYLDKRFMFWQTLGLSQYEYS